MSVMSECPKSHLGADEGPAKGGQTGHPLLEGCPCPLSSPMDGVSFSKPAVFLH
jgi:hypothetical protein